MLKMNALRGYSISSMLYSIMFFTLYYNHYIVANFFFLFATIILIGVYILAGEYDSDWILFGRILSIIFLLAILILILGKAVFLICALITAILFIGTFVCSITINYYKKNKAQSR